VNKLIGKITIPIVCILLLGSINSSQIELSKAEPGEVLVSHIGYTLSYNEMHEQANWVAYELTSKEVQGSYKRTNDFRSDPKAKTESASLADYKGSGYDRGHLAPAGDMKWSVNAMSESFYMSNMSPQRPSFNRGIWRKLESLVRKWAVKNEAVYVTTGGVLTSGLNKIGPNGVSVPDKYYKVILDYKEPVLKGIGFILPNKGLSEPLENFTVSIDIVENITGIDFFYKLPDEIEEELESLIDFSKWDFSGTSISYEEGSEESPVFVGPIDINSASRAELMAIKGIGPVLSERIVGYRKTHGGFSSVDELIQIKGIGSVTLENIRPYVVVESPKRIKKTILKITVYITKTGKKYHRSSCSYLRRSKIPISLKDACARGFTPCSRCNPPRCNEIK